MHRRTRGLRAGTFAALCLALPIGVLAGSHWAVAEGTQAQRTQTQRIPGQATQAGAVAESPERVGRLARVAGTVSFHPDGAERWEPALLNYPVSDGSAFWTEPGAQADIDIASSRIVMDASTELDITTITSQAVNATLPQGQLYLRLRGLAAGESVTVQTPRASVLLRGDGAYGIFAGDTENPTRIRVLAGAARVSGPGFSLDLGTGQDSVVEGLEDFAAHITPLPDDPFLSAQAERDRPMLAAQPAPAPPRAAPSHNAVQRRQQAAPRAPTTPVPTPPPAVAAMPGGEELLRHGQWVQTREYGPIWYPPKAAGSGFGWRPYREGHWLWLRRGGWTWVDNAPWGFAPTHYGRWISYNGRWAWWPGAAQRPVYTPTLFALPRGPHQTGLSPEPEVGMSGREARQMNIVLPSPRDMAPPPRPAPGPILLRPLPGQQMGIPPQQGGR